MSLITPFAGLRPVPGYAADLIAPPYDVMDADEARALAAGRPWSFLHLSRAEIDLPPALDPYDAAVYARAAENLERMVATGLLRRDPRPCYYVYRLSRAGRIQTGLVVAASLAAYRAGRIRRHEVTLAAKEDDRVRQITALGAQTGPAMLLHRRDPMIDETLETVTRGTTPAVDVLAADGVGHTLWVVEDAPTIARLTAGFAAQERLYIADGHHRTAAAERIAAAGQGRTGTPADQGFLAVSFPADALEVMAVHRLVRDLGGLGAAAFLHRVAERFSVTPSPVPVSPVRPGEFGLYLDRAWYRLVLDPTRMPYGDDPVARLDVRLLQDHLLVPILGIGDPRHDPRLDFVGGIRGLAGLTGAVDRGAARVALALHPAPLSDLFAVADRGEVMPPKCTWFETKLADGLVSLVLDFVPAA